MPTTKKAGAPILEGKHAIVFGAGGSIEAAVAREFVAEGAQVFLASRTKSKVQEVREQITAGGGRRESDFLKAIYLELKTDNIEEMKQKILAFGVKKLDVPDPHLYFQAPGGQVFKLVGISEDLSSNEDSTSSRPGSPAS